MSNKQPREDPRMTDIREHQSTAREVDPRDMAAWLLYRLTSGDIAAYAHRVQEQAALRAATQNT